MKTFKIVIEITEVEVKSSNPFIAIANKIDQEKAIKDSIDNRNKAIRDAHITVFSDLKMGILDKLSEAKICFYTTHVFSNRDVTKRNPFDGLYGYLTFHITVNEKDLLVKMKPNVVVEDGFKKLDGSYKLYYSTTSNTTQLNFGNAEGWKPFETSEVLEAELVGFFN
jgi:hypothetical protein